MTIELCKACADGNIPIVHKLLAKGFDPDGLLGNTDTALHWALANYGPNTRMIVELLLLHGANPNTISDPEGNTPLIWACKIPDLDLVKRFILSGTDIVGKDIHGKSALDYARFMKCEDACLAIEHALDSKFGSSPFNAIILRINNNFAILSDCDGNVHQLDFIHSDEHTQPKVNNSCKYVKENDKVTVKFTWDRKLVLVENLTIKSIINNNKK